MLGSSLLHILFYSYSWRVVSADLEVAGAAGPGAGGDAGRDGFKGEGRVPTGEIGGYGTGDDIEESGGGCGDA